MARQLEEVELRGNVEKVDNGFVIRGVWSFSGVGRSDKFQWRAPLDRCSLDALGNPRVLVCSGSFDANSFSANEDEIILEFCRREAETEGFLTSSSSSISSLSGEGEESVEGDGSDATTGTVFSIIGRGHNVIGEFQVEGHATQCSLMSSNSTLPLFQFNMKKRYTSSPSCKPGPSPSPSRSSNTSLNSSVLYRNYQETSVYTGLTTRKRARQETDRKRKREKEARMRAQQWRRQQLRRSTNLTGGEHTPAVISHPPLVPMIKEVKQLKVGQLQICWEITSDYYHTRSFPILAETSLVVVRKEDSIGVSNDSNGLHNTINEEVSFPPFRVEHDSTFFFSHIFDDLLPGTYEISAFINTPKLHARVASHTLEAIVRLPLDEPKNVTSLLYMDSRRKKPFAVVSWTPPASANGNIIAYQVSLQVYRKARGEWATISSLKLEDDVTNCIVPDLPRRSRIRFVVAAITPFGEGKFSASSSVNPLSSSICISSCVICGNEICFHDSDKAHTNELSFSGEPIGPGCCSHVFHDSCLARWIQTKHKTNEFGIEESTCPLCCQSFSLVSVHTLSKDSHKESFPVSHFIFPDPDTEEESEEE